MVFFRSRSCALDEVERPVEVAAVCDDELDLVARAETLQVAGIVARLHPGARAFHVDDLENARVDAVERDVAARFDEHGVAEVAERSRERIEALLLERLASRQLDERRAQALDFCEDLVEPHLLPPWNAYALSHQTHRSPHPVRRTNEQGSPASVDSP